MSEIKDDVEVTSFEHACQLRNYDPGKILPDVSLFPELHREAVTSFAKLVIIAEATNEGHQFNWNDDEEYKWFPWFDMEESKQNPSGFRFLVAYFDSTHSRTAGGSRLCFRTREAAQYVGKTFIDLYRDIMVIKK